MRYQNKKIITSQNNFHPITNKFIDGEDIRQVGGIFFYLSTVAIAFESSSLGSTYDNLI